MRVISGKWRGKKLLSLETNEIRPTTDRIKETIFNMLTTKKFGNRLLHKAIILDCFSGTGALSIEALSRGASFANIWDNSQKSIDIINQNLKTIDPSLYKVKKTNAYTPNKAQNYADIIFIDPPYENMHETPTLLTSLEHAHWIACHTLLIIESATTNLPKLNDTYTILEEKTMGNTTVTFTRKTSNNN